MVTLLAKKKIYKEELVCKQIARVIVKASRLNAIEFFGYATTCGVQVSSGKDKQGIGIPRPTEDIFTDLIDKFDGASRKTRAIWEHLLDQDLREGKYGA